MADQIVIEGGVVKRVRVTEESICTTSEWINELTQVYPACRDVVPGQLALAVSEDKTIYHIGVKPRVIQFLQHIHGDRKFQILMPNSVFSVTMSKRKTVTHINWHFILGQFEDVAFDKLQPVKNFLPNVGSLNDICPGAAKITHKDDRPLRHTINMAIAAILDNPYNFDMFRNEDYTSSFRKAITSWQSKQAMVDAKIKLDKASAGLQKLEALKYETITAAKKKEAFKKRADFMDLRRHALSDIEQLKQPNQWKDYLFPYLEFWTEQHKKLIAEDPIAASDTMLQEIGHAKIGIIKNDGRLDYDNGEERGEDDPD